MDLFSLNQLNWSDKPRVILRFLARSVRNQLELQTARELSGLCKVWNPELADCQSKVFRLFIDWNNIKFMFIICNNGRKRSYRKCLLARTISCMGGITPSIVCRYIYIQSPVSSLLHQQQPISISETVHARYNITSTRHWWGINNNNTNYNNNVKDNEGLLAFKVTSGLREFMICSALSRSEPLSVIRMRVKCFFSGILASSNLTPSPSWLWIGQFSETVTIPLSADWHWKYAKMMEHRSMRWSNVKKKKQFIPEISSNFSQKIFLSEKLAAKRNLTEQVALRQLIIVNSGSIWIKLWFNKSKTFRH